MRIHVAQINTTPGRVRKNVRIMKESIADAKRTEADLLVFPELSLAGYPPGDLPATASFRNQCREHLQSLMEGLDDLIVITGLPVEIDGSVYSETLCLSGDEIRAKHRKFHLAGWQDFDERNHFTPGNGPTSARIRDCSVLLTSGEDLWPEDTLPVHTAGSHAGADELQKHDPDIIINVGAGPFWLGRPEQREERFQMYARQTNAAFVYAGSTGGNGPQVSAGCSTVINREGEIQKRARPFGSGGMTVDFREGHFPDSPSPENSLSEEEALLRALSTGLRDFVRKNGFEEVVLGLSGGIDSSTTAALAVHALGPKHVTGLLLPSRITSSESRDDAALLGENLGIQTHTIEIENIFSSFVRDVQPPLTAPASGMTGENLQARIRGVALMAYSNEKKALVLATGNRSELAAGYATLYGDMVGSIAPVGDLPKTRLYRMARHLNDTLPGDAIPEQVFTKPPSAELREDQVDRDDLPPYEILDTVMEAYFSGGKDAKTISEQHGYDRGMVETLLDRFQRSSFKRYQAPPVIRVHARAHRSSDDFPLISGS